MLCVALVGPWENVSPKDVSSSLRGPWVDQLDISLQAQGLPCASTAPLFRLLLLST